MKKIISLIFLVCFAIPFFALELVPTKDLLAAYLEKDSDVQSAAIDYKKALLSEQNSKIEHGFDITLSTGRMTFKQSDEGSSFTVSPSIKAEVPQAMNLGIEVSGDFGFTSSGSSSEDLSIGFSVDLVSS